MLEGKPFEKKYSDKIHLCQALSPQKETRWVIGSIARLLSQKKQPQKTAIIVGNSDSYLREIKNVLSEYGLTWRQASENSLRDAPAANLLLSVIKALSENISLEWLLHILSYPFFECGVKSEAAFGCLAKDLRRTGLECDREDAGESQGAFVRRLKLLALESKTEQQREVVANNQNKVAEVIAIIRKIPTCANLFNYLKLSKCFVQNHALQTEKSGKKELLELFEQWLSVFYSLDSLCQPTRLRNKCGMTENCEKLQTSLDLDSVSDGNITLVQYIKWLETNLSANYLPSFAPEFTGEVELLNFNDFAGRKFDIVALVNLSHGVLPASFKPNKLLDEEEKVKIKKLVNKPVFRLFEAKGSRYSQFTLCELEPLKFLSICAAFENDLLLCSCVFDDSGKEQAVSEYLKCSFKALGTNSTNISNIKSNIRPAVSLLGKKLLQAKRLDSEFLKSVAIAQEQTKNFMEQKNAPLKERCNNFAFSLPQEYLKKKYPKKLGLLPEYALTPTRVENIARCKFKAFAENFIGIDTEQAPSVNLDMRELGRLAHKVLEVFFNERIKNNTKAGEFSQVDRFRIITIFDKYSQQLLNKLACSHKLATEAKLQWLRMTILKMLSQSLRNAPVVGAWPKSCELAIGTRFAKFSLEAVPLQVGENTLYFGGIIDRVDENHDEVVVVDYKIGASSGIKAKLSEKNILNTHFQIPLYLFLIKHRWPAAKNKNIGGYLLSIRDGVATPVLGIDKMNELAEILQEPGKGGLAHSLQKVLQPMFEGFIAPTPGEACDNCRLSIACRVVNA